MRTLSLRHHAGKIVILLFLLVLLFILFAAPLPLQAQVVISQVYGGGGNSGAKVALVASTTSLTGACPSSVADLVGYEGANCPAPAHALNNTAAAERLASGCALTGINTADFAADTPAPRNTSSPATVCSTGYASPWSLALGGSTLLTVGAPAGMAVSSIAADLAPIAGADSPPLFDDATHGVAGDGVFSAPCRWDSARLPGRALFP